jgi:polysaccharide pyruvyl transferase WcaK-like protein
MARIVVSNGVEDFKSLLDQMDMVITSKLHPGVMSVSGYVPTLCLAYDHKQTGLFKLLGLENCIVPIMEVSYERLSSKIDYVWKDRERIRALLQTRIPELQNGIREAVKEALMFYDQRKKNS